MTLNYFIEAEYADGFTITQNQADHSVYESGRSAFFDIDKQKFEDVHGKLVRFSAFSDTHRADIDFTDLPDSARPIYFREMERDFHQGEWISEPRIMAYKFGYQYTDEDGKNHKEIQELP